MSQITDLHQITKSDATELHSELKIQLGAYGVVVPPKQAGDVNRIGWEPHMEIIGV